MSGDSSTPMATDTTTTTTTTTIAEYQTRRRLVEHIEHHELVDALPYADDFDATLKMQVNSLVESETKRFQPADYLQPLGDAATSDLVGTAITKGDIARTQRGEAMPALDLDYAIKPLRNNASEADVAEHERKCAIVAAYEQARLDALESSHRFGEALWDARIRTLEQILLHERAALKETQRSIDALNAERKTAQLRAGERLFASERELHALCVKNVELSRVVQQLQAEVDELQLRQQQQQQPQQN